MAKRKPFFRACGRCFSIFVCVGKKRRALPKTQEGHRWLKNRWSRWAGTSGTGRGNRGWQQVDGAFWGAPADSKSWIYPKLQVSGIITLHLC
eukprot:COSAG06_NODE_86_length_25025_cov_6.420806_3_plen_92_part_00